MMLGKIEEVCSTVHVISRITGHYGSDNTTTQPQPGTYKKTELISGTVSWQPQAHAYLHLPVLF